MFGLAKCALHSLTHSSAAPSSCPPCHDASPVLVSLSPLGLQTRSSLSSRASGPVPVHRIKDRDYLGWMDFGRRSAEEYEYSS